MRPGGIIADEAGFQQLNAKFQLLNDEIYLIRKYACSFRKCMMPGSLI